MPTVIRLRRPSVSASAIANSGAAAEAEWCVVKSPNPRPCADDYLVGGVHRISAVITAQLPTWDALVDAVRSKAPNARIILVGYGLSQGHDICAPPSDRYVEGYIANGPAITLYPIAFGAGSILNAHVNISTDPTRN